MTKRTTTIFSLAFAALVALAAPAFAEDAYLVGMTAALTGPASGSYAPALTALNLYVDRVNKAGGINGHPIKLVVEDDQGQASRAAANVKKLLTENNLVLLVNGSLSSTYLPTMAEARRAGMPLLFAGICPKEVYPPADKLMFCPTQFGAQYDTRAAFDFVKEKAGGDVRMGVIALSITVSRAEADFAMKYAKQVGFTAVDEEIAPPSTPDYTPYATRLMAKNPNWVYAWGPWFMQVKIYEALRKIGWKGDFICSAQPEAQQDVPRFKDPRLYIVGPDALVSDNLPAQQEIAAAAKAGGLSYPTNLMVEGWIQGTVIAEALKKAGWPATPATVRDALTHLKVKLGGLRGGDMNFSDTNHFRATQYYRVFHWSDKDQKVAVAKDWFPYEVK
ncbi:MAG TPA: ABC transporter substrate-binding protein [Stellaceae bacterium]